MAETQVRKIITLIGRIETPVATNKPSYRKHGCLVQLVGDPQTNKRPLYTPIGKVVKGARQAPTILKGYRGYVKITAVDYSQEQLCKQAQYFLQKNFIGALTNEGYARVEWFESKIEDFNQKETKSRKKFKIRKGLGTNYPKELQKLLIAIMLHGFVHTEKHQSKIYQQITIEDDEIKEACLNHHNGENSKNPLLPFVKCYDNYASLISRKKPFRTISRYDYEKGTIDFTQLAKEIMEVQDSSYKLYHYLYHSRELARIVESLEYGRSNLRTHLLLMANLTINDYYIGKLIKGELQIINERVNSPSASK